MMTYREALNALHQNGRICRKGWNGKGMYLFLVRGAKVYIHSSSLHSKFPETSPVKYTDHIVIKTTEGTLVPWLASQTDQMAEDWIYLKELKC